VDLPHVRKSQRCRFEHKGAESYSAAAGWGSTEKGAGPPGSGPARGARTENANQVEHQTRSAAVDFSPPSMENIPGSRRAPRPRKISRPSANRRLRRGAGVSSSGHDDAGDAPRAAPVNNPPATAAQQQRQRLQPGHGKTSKSSATAAKSAPNHGTGFAPLPTLHGEIGGPATIVRMPPKTTEFTTHRRAEQQRQGSSRRASRSAETPRPSEKAASRTRRWRPRPNTPAPPAIHRPPSA